MILSTLDGRSGILWFRQRVKMYNYAQNVHLWTIQIHIIWSKFEILVNYTSCLLLIFKSYGTHVFRRVSHVFQYKITYFFNYILQLPFDTAAVRRDNPTRCGQQLCCWWKLIRKDRHVYRSAVYKHGLLRKQLHTTNGVVSNPGVECNDFLCGCTEALLNN